MDQIEQRLNFKFDTEDNHSRLFKEMFEHATSDRNEIKEMLRQELLNQYMLDFKVDSNSISEK
jgi:CHAD domain-containing protein